MKNLFWKQLTILNLIKVCTASNDFQESNKQCTGKHQIPIQDLFEFDFAKEIKEPIDAKNFDVLPDETTLEHNDQTIVISMKYNTKVPTIQFGASAGLPTYRFHFLYFQWYEKSPATKLPFELHAVFYNAKFKQFQNALNRKNMIVVLAFSLKINQRVPQLDQHTSITNFTILNTNMMFLQSGFRKIFIENLPLNIWLPTLRKEYIMYEGGYFPFHNCKTQVLWVDFDTDISMEAELLKEFELLRTSSGGALMKQYKPFLRASGPLVVNFGIYSTGEDDALGGIPFVDAYNDDDYYGENVVFGGVESPKVITKKTVALIIFMTFYCRFF